MWNVEMASIGNEEETLSVVFNRENDEMTKITGRRKCCEASGERRNRERSRKRCGNEISARAAACAAAAARSLRASRALAAAAAKLISLAARSRESGGVSKLWRLYMWPYRNPAIAGNLLSWKWRRYDRAVRRAEKLKPGEGWNLKLTWREEAWSLLK